MTEMLLILSQMLLAPARLKIRWQANEFLSQLLHSEYCATVKY